MTAPILLSLGSANADFQVRVDDIPAAGQTAVASRFARFSGGKAANVAYLARRLGFASCLLACVGDDRFGEQVLSPLAKVGVDLAHVCVAPDTPTGTALIAVPRDGHKAILFAPNANDAWPSGAVAAVDHAIAAAPDGSILVADCEIPAGVVGRAIAACERHAIPVVLDPSPASRVDRSWLRRVFAITPNAVEARALAGFEIADVQGAADAARRLAGDGVGLVCVKLRDGGAVVAHRGQLAAVPAQPVRVVDTTGAGDAFAGALGVALLERRAPLNAAIFATAAAHVAVTGYGSQPAYPDRRRLEPLVASIASGVHALAHP